MFFFSRNQRLSLSHAQNEFQFWRLCTLSNSLFQADRKSLSYLSIFWQLEWKERKLKKIINVSTTPFRKQLTTFDISESVKQSKTKCQFLSSVNINTYAKFAPIHSKGTSNRDIILKLLNKMFTYHGAQCHLLSRSLTFSQSKRFPKSICVNRLYIRAEQATSFNWVNQNCLYPSLERWAHLIYFQLCSLR